MAPYCKSGLLRKKTPKQIKQRCLRTGNIMLIRTDKKHCSFCHLDKYLVICAVCDSVGYILLPKNSENMARMNRDDSSSTSSDSSAEAEDQELNPDGSDTIQYVRFLTMPPHIPREVEMPLHIVNLCLWGQFFRKLAKEFKEAHQKTNNFTDELKENIRIRRLVIFPEDHYHFESCNMNVNYNLNNINSMSLIWKAVSFKIFPSIYRIVTFAKSIVGYRILTLPDKLLLIKRGFFAIWLTRATKVSTSTEIVFHDGSALSFRQLEAIYDRNFAKDIFSYVVKIKALNMTDDEMAGFTTCLLFYPHSTGQTDVVKISKVHRYMWEALQTVIIDSGITDYYSRFEALGDGIRHAWRLAARHHELLSWCRSNWQLLSLPPIVSEIFDIPYTRSYGPDAQNVADSIVNLTQRKG